MTNAQEILTGLRENTGIPWAYRYFDMTPDFPFGVMLEDKLVPFYADNIAYFSKFAARLELYDAVPNDAIESAIESWLSANVVTWRKEPRDNVSPDTDTAPYFMTAYELEAI